MSRGTVGKPKVDVEVPRKFGLRVLVVSGLLFFVACDMLTSDFGYRKVLAAQEEVRVLEPSEDAYVSQLNSNSNYGHDEVISIRSYITIKESFNHRIYIKFDLNQLDREFCVASATLRLYKYIEGSNVGVRTIEVKRVLDQWSETSINWTGKPSIAQDSTDSTRVNGSGRWYQWNVTADVRSWVNEDAQDNGFCLMDSKEDSTIDYASVFYSREAAEMCMYRPKLELRLEPEISEPKSLSYVPLSATALIVGCAVLATLVGFWKKKKISHFADFPTNSKQIT